MSDKVLAIVRETMMHENRLENLIFQPTTSQILLEILQPDDRFQYPEHELILIFCGIRSLAMEGMGDLASDGQEILGFECVAAIGDYEATITRRQSHSATEGDLAG